MYRDTVFSEMMKPSFASSPVCAGLPRGDWTGSCFGSARELPERFPVDPVGRSDSSMSSSV